LDSMRLTLVLRAVDEMSSTARSAFGKVRKDLDLLNDKVGRVGDGMVGLGAGSTAAGVAILAALMKPVEAYKELDRAQTNLRIAFSTAHGSSPFLNSIEKQAQDLGTVLEGTMNDYARVAIAMKETGLADATIEGGGLQAMAHMAVLLEMNKERAGQLGAAMSNAWDISGKDFLKFANILVKGKQGLGVDVESFKYFSGYVAPEARAMGMTGVDAMKDHMAIAAMMVQQGKDPASAGAGFAQVYKNLSIISAKLASGRGWRIKGAEDLVKQYGINLDFYDEKGRFKGLEYLLPWVDQTRAKFGENKQGFQRLMNSLFNTEGASVLNLMNTASFNKQMAVMNDRAGIETEMERRTASLSYKWEAAKGTVVQAMAKIAETVGPELKWLADLLGKAADRVQQFVEAHPRLTRAFFSGATVLGVLLVALGGATLALGLMLKTGSKLVSTWKDIGSAWRTGRGLVKSLGEEAVKASTKIRLMHMVEKGNGIMLPSLPKVLGKTAGTAVSEGVVALPTIAKGAMGRVVGIVTGGLSAVWGALGGILSGIGAFFGAITAPVWIVVGIIVAAAALIYKFWVPIRNFFVGIWRGIKQGFLEAIEPMRPQLHQFAVALQPVWEALGKVWAWIKQLFVPMGESNKGLATGIKVGIAFGKVLALQVMQGIVVVVGVFKLLKAVFYDFPKWLWGGITKTWNLLKSMYTVFRAAGGTLVRMLADGMKAAASHPIEAIKAVVGKVRKFLPFSPAKEGPLSDLHRLRFMETIAESIRPQALISRISGAMGMARAAFAAGAPSLAIAAGLGGSAAARPQGPAVVIHANFTLTGTATAQDQKLIEQGLMELLPKLEQALARRQASGARRDFK